jgi:hypothetical protein
MMFILRNIRNVYVHCGQGGVFLNVKITIITNNNCVALVRERTIPTEWPPPVGEVSANRVVRAAKPDGRIKVGGINGIL